MAERVRYVWRGEEGREEPIPMLEQVKRMVVIDEKTVGAGEITFLWTHWGPKTSWHARHRHPHAEEVIYMVSGRAVGGVNGEERTFEPGDIIWVPKGEVHWAYNPFDEPAVILTIYTKASLKEVGYQVVEKKAPEGARQEGEA